MVGGDGVPDGHATGKCAQHWPAIKAIGLSGQMHGAVLLDAEEGDPSGHSVERHPLRRRVRRAGGDGAGAASGGGQPAMPGFTAPKLLWVRRHEPQHFQRTATVLLPIICATG